MDSTPLGWHQKNNFHQHSSLKRSRGCTDHGSIPNNTSQNQHRKLAKSPSAPHPSKAPASRKVHPCPDANKKNCGFFEGVTALFVLGGVNQKRLQIWKERVKDLGGLVVESCENICQHLTHIFASNDKFLAKEVAIKNLQNCNSVMFLKYEWIEHSLKEGRLLPYEMYYLEYRCTHFPCCKIVAVSDNSAVQLNAARTSEQMKKDDIYKEIRSSHAITKTHGLQNEMDSFDANLDLDDENSHTQGDFKSNEKIEEMQESPSLNNHITRFLREMWDIYESVLGDEWRALTYRKAAINLERLPFQISKPEELQKLQGIGKSMVEKVKEILATGRLQKLDALNADPKVKVLKEFASVWGIGPKLAQKLYQAGHRTIDDLSKDPSLSRTAQIGVLYHKDLIVRIPRNEIKEAEEYVQIVAEEICPGVLATKFLLLELTFYGRIHFIHCGFSVHENVSCLQVSIQVVGSYRRGKSTCGDIDILATHQDGFSHAGLLVKLVEKLKFTGFIVDGLHCSDHSSEGIRKVDTFMGVCRLAEEKLYRRLDIKVYPKECYAFALIYFTGNDVLNRKIRYAAQRKGYKLNDQGLFLRFGGKNGVASTTSIACETEEEVFNKIGFPYYEPHDRNL